MENQLLGFFSPQAPHLVSEMDSLLCGHQVRVSANLCPLLIWHRLVTWQVSHDHWGHQQVPSGLLRAKAHSGYCSFPPLPHFTCGSSLQFCKVDETAAPLVCTQHLWSLTRSSSSPNPSLGFERNYFPPTNFFNFRLSLIFSALTPKMPALHKAAETKAIYKCQGIGIPISEAVDTLLLKGLPELLKIVGDLSDWVSLERTKKEIRVRYPSLKHKLAEITGMAEPTANSVSTEFLPQRNPGVSWVILQPHNKIQSLEG